MAVRDPLLVGKSGECGVYGTPMPAAKGVQKWVYPADSAEQNGTRPWKKALILDDGWE
jgi:hypothetical protein